MQKSKGCASVSIGMLDVQIVADNPRWHFVDFGQMSEAFLTGTHLRDEHHPGTNFMLQVMNIYLNLYQSHGSKAVQRATHSIGDVGVWDQEYDNHMEEMQAEYAQDAERFTSGYSLPSSRTPFPVFSDKQKNSACICNTSTDRYQR